MSTAADAALISILGRRARGERYARRRHHPPMRVLVTGATGLIGSTVCDALLARGDEVVGLTRDVEKARPKNPTVNWHAWQAATSDPLPMRWMASTASST